MGKHHKDSKTKGFTILEVLIALSIFSIGILGLVKAQTSSSLQNVKSRLYTARAADAAGWIEQTMNLQFDNNGVVTPVLYDHYEITKAVTNRVLDPNTSSSNIVDTVRRVDISVWENIRGRMMMATVRLMKLLKGNKLEICFSQ